MSISGGLFVTPTALAGVRGLWSRIKRCSGAEPWARLDELDDDTAREVALAMAANAMFRDGKAAASGTRRRYRCNRVWGRCYVVVGEPEEGHQPAICEVQPETMFRRS